MAWGRDSRDDGAAAEAREAWESGAAYYVPALSPGATGKGRGWAEAIASIESVGWRLHTWAVARDIGNRPTAYPLFTR